jgi:hypothetical protein
MGRASALALCKCRPAPYCPTLHLDGGHQRSPPPSPLHPPVSSPRQRPGKERPPSLPLPFLSLCDTKKSRQLASPERTRRCHTGSWFCARAAPGVGGRTPSGNCDHEGAPVQPPTTRPVPSPQRPSGTPPQPFRVARPGGVTVRKRSSRWRPRPRPPSPNREKGPRPLADAQPGAVEQRRRQRCLPHPTEPDRSCAFVLDLPRRLVGRRGPGRSAGPGGQRLPGRLDQLHQLPDRAQPLPGQQHWAQRRLRQLACFFPEVFSPCPARLYGCCPAVLLAMSFRSAYTIGPCRCISAAKAASSRVARNCCNI